MTILATWRVWYNMAMRIGRTTLFGSLIEIRSGDWRETLLVDGKPISSMILGSLRTCSHFFTLTDADGNTRNCEVLTNPEGLLSTKATVLVDGRRVQHLKLRGGKVVDLRCPKCEYSLVGQEPSEDRVTCPECGHVTTLGAIGVRTASDLLPPEGHGA